MRGLGQGFRSTHVLMRSWLGCCCVFFGGTGGAEDHYSNKNAECANCGGKVDLWSSHEPARGEADRGYMAYRYNNRAVRHIQSHGDKLASGETTAPLFMYIALQVAHAPNQADSFANLFPQPTFTTDFADYNGMCSAWDSTLGNVTAALKEAGMWDNTLIM